MSSISIGAVAGSVSTKFLESPVCCRPDAVLLNASFSRKVPIECLLRLALVELVMGRVDERL